MGILDNYIYSEEIINKFLDHLGFAFYVVILFLVGYIIGYVLSAVLKRLLNIGELQKSIVKYGTMTTSLWSSITGILSWYVKWYIVFAVLTITEITIVVRVFDFMSELLWLLILSTIGLILGGISYKLFKDIFYNTGLEQQLEKYNLKVIGGLNVSSILGGIIKWYVVLLFVDEGIAQLGLLKLSLFMDRLMGYIPNAILGVLVILTALMISSFVGMRIKVRKIAFANLLAVSVETIIVFFGIVLALPKFGITNISILEDSFKIMFLGLSIGFGIALGFGLKDSVAKMAEKYEKKLQ